jgi:hypothetical protein
MLKMQIRTISRHGFVSGFAVPIIVNATAPSTTLSLPCICILNDPRFKEEITGLFFQKLVKQ